VAGLPLDDVRVLDLGDAVAEAAARLLADLGADVLKIEPPGGAISRGTRRVGVVSLDFALSNANKRCGTADLRVAGDLAAVRALVAEADVVLVDLDTAAVVDPESLISENPDLVVVVSSPFGRSGPRKDWQATDATLFALSGAASRSGRPGDAPLLPPAGIATATAATQAAWTALIGVLNARAGRGGQIIDLSHHEAVVTGLDPAFGVQGSAAAGRSGTVRRDRPPADSYPVYRCADGYVRLCLLAKRQWRGMREWLGEPAELMDERFDRIIERVKATDLIEPRITALFADQPGATLVEEAARRGVPLAQVLTLGEAVAAKHFVQAGTVVPMELAPGVTATIPVGCIDVDGARLGLSATAPNEPVAGLPAWRGRDRGPRGGHSPGLPLSGLRVLDLGVIVFGAEIGRAFADLGADVIKIESLAFPDGLRQTRGGELMNASFAWGHRNKRSLGLDLRSPAGRDVFLQLATSSDVVLANFKPGTLASLGLDHAALSALNPRIVVVESAAFSSRGPWARRLGYGPLVRAACGISSLWKYAPDDTACWDGVTVYPDHVAAKVGALAAVSAVHQARRTGRGARIELAQSDVVLHQLAAAAAQESLSPGSVAATGNRGNGILGGLLPCAGDDEWCVVEPRTEAEVENLRSVVGDVENLARWTAERTPDSVMTVLQSAGVPAAAMLRLPELLDDPQLAARGTYTRFHHPALGHDLPTEDIRAPYGASIEPPLSPAPHPGEHTREIAAELLGLDEVAVEQLLREGVLHEATLVETTTVGAS